MGRKKKRGPTLKELQELAREEAREVARDLLDDEEHTEAANMRTDTSISAAIPANLKTQVQIRLKYDEVTWKTFLFAVLKSYVDLDDDFYDWWESRRPRYSRIANRWQKKMTEMRKEGQRNFTDLAPSSSPDEAGESIFDFLVSEFGDLEGN